MMNKNGIRRRVVYATKKLHRLLFVCMLMCSILSFSALQVVASGNETISQQPDAKSVSLLGKVVDKKGLPIVGATVTVSGTTTGTITDMDGNFKIQVPAGSTIVVSFIGFQTQRIKVSSAITMSEIVLEENVESLEEVTVVGYGQVKRANLTGAVSSIEMKKLEDIPAPNLSSVLMGTMAGVKVGEVTGNPLATTTLKIRVGGSWNSGDPLFVIDGFIRDIGAFNMLDPSEIESISVLKDAAAAIYGVRGSDGVVLVTTRRGKEGKAKISYSGSYGVGVGANMPNMMSAFEQATALNDLYRENLINGSTSVAYFSDEELNAFKNLDYNWIEMGWKNSQNTRHTLSVSGGTDKVKYNLSGSYMYADGNFSNLNLNRYSFRSGLDVNFTDQFTGSFTMSFNQRKTDSPLNAKDAEPDRMYGTFSDLTRTPRWNPAFIDGLPVGNGLASSDTHPLEIFNSGSFRTSYSNDATLSGKLNYDIKKIKGLKASVSINYSRGNSNGKQLSKPYYVYKFLPNNMLNKYDIDGNITTEQPVQGHLLSNTIDGEPRKITNGDKLYESASFSYAYQLSPSLSYANKIGKHDVNALLVYEQSESGGNGLNWSRTGLVLDGITTSVAYSTIASANSNINTLSRRQGFIGRFNYTYNNKYSLESTARYEASTNFAKGYRWGLFPSVAASWRISEEDFFKDKISFMDVAKLRVSYGLLGNDKVNSITQYRETYSTSTDRYMFGTNVYVTGITPEGEGLVVLNSTWEKTQSYNMGIDTRFFECLSFNIDGFYKHSYDILDERRSIFPQNSGVSAASPKLNFGIQDAWGGEIEITYQKDLNKDWGVTAGVNFAWSDSKVIRKSQSAGVVGTWQDEEGRRRGGETGYSMWTGVNNDGLASTWDDVNAYINYLKGNAAEGTIIEVLGKKEENFRPGMLMFVDRGKTVKEQTPDGRITSEGDVNIISPYDNPPFDYAIKLGVSYKRIKVDAILDGVFGHDVIFEKGFYTGASGGSRTGAFLSDQSNQLIEWYGNYAKADAGTRALTNAETAIYPRLDGDSFRGERSEFWMRNGHSLRLRSINVSYSLPAKYAKKLGLESLRLFGTGTNILTLINPYPYKDAYVGYWSDYPQVRSFNLGVNITL